MTSAAHGLSSALYASHLRRELSERAQSYAGAHGLECFLTSGGMPMAAFPPCDAGHGNFAPRSWRAIQQNPDWRRRLGKVHTQARSAFPLTERSWKELDTCASSDALLMNIFCYPGVAADARMAARLGIQAGASPEFGVRARVPLDGGKFDRTEVDMRLGDLLVEAKLTESDFQARTIEAVESYRGFAEVFDRRSLPKRNGQYLGYQLIRNVLAAHATGCSFCVLLDAGRPDLLESWYAVLRCVIPADLRVRCKVLTWQELSEELPDALKKFLAEKYGIS